MWSPLFLIPDVDRAPSEFKSRAAFLQFASTLGPASPTGILVAAHRVPRPHQDLAPPCLASRQRRPRRRAQLHLPQVNPPTLNGDARNGRRIRTRMDQQRNSAAAELLPKAASSSSTRTRGNGAKSSGGFYAQEAARQRKQAASSRQQQQARAPVPVPVPSSLLQSRAELPVVVGTVPIYIYIERPVRVLNPTPQAASEAKYQPVCKEV
ncbi:hypothetical protein EVG20_g10746 [Dentipellis fragilis]|uniref:Uncharacterized protein n=1 Tax=Dentipellis fragilis TaxID=205917 RepID=A0A4Y9XTW7_9AGAM|nr:hypothetical protein EVG20_g10746 [Dentipellis fragilis]